MESHTLCCQDAKRIDLVDYLAQLGHHPRHIRRDDHWYLSPFREEKTPSFKVNKRLNLWFDHGTGKGGDLIEFGTLYHHCTIPELLERLTLNAASSFISFQQPLPSELQAAGERKDSPAGRIEIVDTRTLVAQSLLDYLTKRNIPPDIAQKSCQEVHFSLYGKKQIAIGFPNRSGGYELRSEQFKGSSSPKDISFFDNRTNEIAVFEGFFNYLSFQTINRDKQPPLTSCLVLNSLAFLERSRPLMEQFNRIHLALDRDDAGRTFTRKALAWNPDKYIDRSEFYQGHKDLNDWLIHQRMRPKLNRDRRMGRSL
ncbi:MAG TPA: toprim domain-containing protein [Puia sp.]|uniref:toprim domain-containing protein n=1 Tax=Puia sp. TaxID=2045100 RepID=UPI002C056355|nr:toprim domain-containing protein [Puia sp.]HVU93716.1 toprim domain-containing protein [Puia sp.]